MFVMPFVPRTVGNRTTYWPKYVTTSVGDSWNVQSDALGTECMVLITAALQSELDSIAAQPDATRVATGSNIDTTVNSTQAQNITDFLENTFAIPAQWITAGMTRRVIVRRVLWTFKAQHFVYVTYLKSLKQLAQENSVTLSTQFSAMPSAFQDVLQTMLTDMSVTAGQLGLTGTTTLRQLLASLGSFFASTAFVLGPYTV